MKASVIYVSDMPDDVVESMHMIPASSLAEAIEKANILLQKESLSITAIPDGVAIIVNGCR